MKESFDYYPEVEGIFDTSHTINDWLNEFWPNLVVLVVSPIILLVITVIAFLKKDISL